jgi:hypothetical protein
MEVNKILVEREKNYGNFCINSIVAQSLKDELRSTKNWTFLSYDKKEALDMVMSKISRLLTGDPEHLDSWNDMIGYLTLVTENLKNDKDSLR